MRTINFAPAQQITGADAKSATLLMEPFNELAASLVITTAGVGLSSAVLEGTPIDDTDDENTPWFEVDSKATPTGNFFLKGNASIVVRYARYRVRLVGGDGTTDVNVHFSRWRLS